MITLLKKTILFTLSFLLSWQLMAQSPIEQKGKRKVSWKAEKGVLYYDGNIYYKGKIIRFRTKDTELMVPQKAIVEIFPIKGFNAYGEYIIFRPDKKAPEKVPIEAKKEAPKEQEWEIIDYREEAISSPEIEKIIEEDGYFETSAPSRRSKKHKDKKSQIDMEGYFGLAIFQDSLTSQGVLGTFKGDGVTQGAALSMDIYPRERAHSDLFFSSILNINSFETSVTEKTNQSSKNVTKKNSTMRLRLHTQGYLIHHEKEDLSLGLGLSWEKLPFFETINEAEGKGDLTSKTSIGFSFLGRYVYYHLFFLEKLVIDASFSPIGANTESVRQFDLEATLFYSFSKTLSFYTKGILRYQKLRFPKETAQNSDAEFIYPKTIQESLGISLGLSLKL